MNPAFANKTSISFFQNPGNNINNNKVNEDNANNNTNTNK